LKTRIFWSSNIVFAIVGNFSQNSTSKYSALYTLNTLRALFNLNDELKAEMVTGESLKARQMVKSDHLLQQQIRALGRAFSYPCQTVPAFLLTTGLSFRSGA
jgi:hypothetical protein